MSLATDQSVKLSYHPPWGGRYDFDELRQFNRLAVSVNKHSFTATNWYDIRGCMEQIDLQCALKPGHTALRELGSIPNLIQQFIIGIGLTALALTRSQSLSYK